MPETGLLNIAHREECSIAAVFPHTDFQNHEGVVDILDAISTLPPELVAIIRLRMEHPDDPIAVLAARARLQLRTFERRLQEARKQFALVMGLDFPTGSKKTPGSRSG
jgi:hypothetical protein